MLRMMTTEKQEAAIRRIAARCSVRGIVLADADTGAIQVGFESTATGRDREALIDRDGKRLATFNTYGGA